MECEVFLSAVELYFLGRLMQAKYIDYSYIAMMEDIEKHYKAAEGSAIAALSTKGVVSEDFSGNIAVDEENIALFKPVFEGLISSSVELVMPPESGQNIFCRMHVLGNSITKAVISGKTIGFSRFEKETLESYLLSLTGALTDEAPPEKGDDMETPDRVILIKCTAYAGETMMLQFYVCHGRLYLNQGNDTFEQISEKEYLEAGKLLLGGEIYVTQE